MGKEDEEKKRLEYFNYPYILLGRENTNFLSQVAQQQQGVLALILCATH